MLSLAGANPRDYAILQVFLQTGIRVSELAHLRIEDIDFIKPAITVRGKGSVEREIALEKKGIHALKSYLGVRPDSDSDRIFLNYQGEPISAPQEGRCDETPQKAFYRSLIALFVFGTGTVVPKCPVTPTFQPSKEGNNAGAQRSGKFLQCPFETIDVSPMRVRLCRYKR